MVMDLLYKSEIDVVLIPKEKSLFYSYYDTTCSLIPLGVSTLVFNYHIIYRPAFSSNLIATIDQNLLKSHENGMNSQIVANNFRISKKTCLKGFGDSILNLYPLLAPLIIFVCLAAVSCFWIFTTKYGNRTKTKSTSRLLTELKVLYSLDGEQYSKDLDLLLKFESILSSNEKKFKRKLKDLEKALSFHGENMQKFLSCLEPIRDIVILFN